tara:strand:+ start:145 stop:318 length:174 start_codon:yes stop_codon:yes gene_type:complete
MAISRSSIPQQINKPGVKKKSKVKKVLKGLGKGLFSPAAVAFEAIYAYRSRFSNFIY